MRKLSCFVLLIVVMASPSARAQEREDRTLLTWEQMRAIISEVSGERPLQYVLEMVPYPRVRPVAEYSAHFRESEVMARLAREFGFSNVEIEVFPQQGQGWQATQAELWIVKPDQMKLIDFRDVAVAIASGSQSGDVTAELVDVGVGGRPEDYAGKDLKGKIVLGATSSGTLQRLAVFERGAVGVISYNPIHPEADIDQIGSQSVSGAAPDGQSAGFGWSVSPRMGRALASRLARGETLTLRSIVKAEAVPGKMETVHAVIPGDGSSDQEVAVSGHLYEGYLKQGANDDASGCAMTLEMGRALIRLVADGKLPKPKRTIHFLWVPEISGTRAWLAKHEDVRKKLVADLNFDMEGLGLAKNGSMWVIHRTPDTFPTFLNDVSQSVVEFIAELNRERVRYRSGGYGFTLPVISPNGSRDPFYIKVDKHYGASDHVVYIGLGIPSVMFITWPDPFYHSSHDIPDKLDPTQFKRAGVVGLGALAVVANADEAMAARVAAESLARGTERMGDAQRKGLGYLADVGEAAGLLDAYKEALNAVRHQAQIEKAVVRSASVLFPAPAEGARKLATFDSLIDQRAAALQNEVKAFYRLQAERMKAPATDPVATAAEQQAARMIPERVGGAGGFGGGGRGARPGGAPGAAPDPARAAMMEAMRRLPGHMTSELGVLVGQQKSVLEIRDFIAGEFEPVPLADVVAYFEAQVKGGAMKITEKPEPPAPKGRKRTQ
jgi:hypothetical protein